MYFTFDIKRPLSTRHNNQFLHTNWHFGQLQLNRTQISVCVTPIPPAHSHRDSTICADGFQNYLAINLLLREGVNPGVSADFCYVLV